MIRNYIIIALRKLWKNKLYTAINITGLTVGLCACFLIGIYVSHELSYDKFNEHKDRIVRVTMETYFSGTQGYAAVTGTKTGPQFKRTFPAVENYVRTFIRHNVVSSGDQSFEEPRILYADEPFFSIFTFPLIEGDKGTALNAPDKMVITESTAKKYFNDIHAIGKTITTGGKDYRVSAVCKDAPQNSQIKFDFVTQFLNIGNNVKEETWWTANWITYLLLRDNQSVSGLQTRVDDYMKTKAVRDDAELEGNDYLAYHLEPLTRVHLYSSLAGFEPNGKIAYIYIFSLVALLILVIAGANYTNLSTAQSVGRSGEIGMRKVMGASRKQVFLQFIGESSVITFGAALFALILSVLLIPSFNHVTGKAFYVSDLLQPLPLLGLFLFAFLVSLLAGLYPATVLSATRISGILKKGFTFTGGRHMLRKSLIVIQFGISVFLISYTVIIMRQMHYMQSKDLGYDKDQIVVLPIGGNMLDNFQNLKEGFERVPGVESVTASYETPEFVEWGDGMTAIDERGKHDVALNAMPVDLDFTKTLKIKMASGRDFQESDFAMLDTSNNRANYRQPYMINETLAKKIGWTPENAIGRTIENRALGPVVGVIKDFNFESLHEPIGPLLIFLGRQWARVFMIRINSRQVKSTLANLEATWKQRIPERPFSYHFLDEDYNNLYLAETRSASLFSIASGLAIVLACLGLFGLAAFTTVQRTKEIGIRRVLGAGVGNITTLIARNFLQLVVIAMLIALPLSWWAGNKWLQDFAFRMPVRPSVFLVTAAATVLIALFTVSYHAIRMAWTSPVKSLRTE